MTTKLHRAIFWAAIAAAFMGIAIFSMTQSWAAVLTVGACAIIAAFAGEAGDIYEEEGQR